MPVFEFRSSLPAPAEEVFEWHRRPGALQRLIPPWDRVEIQEQTSGIEPHSRVVLRLRRGPLAVQWVAEHGPLEPGRYFVDHQVSGPFARWEHHHRFHPISPLESELEDRVEFRLPLGAPVEALMAGTVRRMLERMFRHRHAVLRHDLERHAALEGARPLEIAVTGASGLIGSRLTAFLTTGGHRVHRLVRRDADPRRCEIAWDPARGRLDPSRLEGLDALIHLAGEGIASGPWTAARKERILRSREQGTRLLADTLATLDRPPAVWVSASAVGYYGSSGDQEVTEDSPAGSGFLAEVCRVWEGATEPARAAGVRVAIPRIGLVLAAEGGLLRSLLPIFRLGLGGRLGSGRQPISWIALEDLIGSIHLALRDPELEGPYNAVAPRWVDNRGFTHRLGSVLGRPTPLPVPATLLRRLPGEMGSELLLGGARVRPTRLERRSFPFLFPDLEAALRYELGRT